MDSSTLIQIVEVGKKYSGHRWGLEACSLRVREGGITGLVGPNGAGKTTLLRLIAGLILPTTGTVTVMGRRPRDSIAVLADLGYVAQNHPLYGEFRVSEMLRFGEALNPRWDRGLFEQRMEISRIPLDQRIDTMSGGQRAQVALAMALAKKPRLLLLDEPVASLDPLARREFLDTLLDSVSQLNLTVLVSSHLIEDIERVCSRLIVLSRSHLQLDGEITDLLAAHRYVASLDATPGSGPHIIGPISRDAASGIVVRIDAGSEPPLGGRSISLEELILAYMNSPAATQTVTHLQGAQDGQVG